MFIPGKSDHDYVTVRQNHTKAILSGMYNQKTWPQEKSVTRYSTSTQKYDEVTDKSFMEIEHLVNLLLKGNVNALWAVMSPIIKKDHPYLQELRQIVLSQPNKLPYHSIHGMSIAQQADAVKRPDMASGNKGLSVAARTIQFGQRLLTNWTFNFEVTDSTLNFLETPDHVDYYRRGLDYAHKHSNLPERPDPEPFRNFLFRIRCNDLLGIEQ